MLLCSIHLKHHVSLEDSGIYYIHLYCIQVLARKIVKIMFFITLTITTL